MKRSELERLFAETKTVETIDDKGETLRETLPLRSRPFGNRKQNDFDNRPIAAYSARRLSRKLDCRKGESVYTDLSFTEDWQQEYALQILQGRSENSAERIASQKTTRLMVAIRQIDGLTAQRELEAINDKLASGKRLTLFERQRRAALRSIRHHATLADCHRDRAEILEQARDCATECAAIDQPKMKELIRLLSNGVKPKRCAFEMGESRYAIAQLLRKLRSYLDQKTAKRPYRAPVVGIPCGEPQPLATLPAQGLPCADNGRDDKPRPLASAAPLSIAELSALRGKVIAPKAFVANDTPKARRACSVKRVNLAWRACWDYCYGPSAPETMPSYQAPIHLSAILAARPFGQASADAVLPLGSAYETQPTIVVRQWHVAPLNAAIVWHDPARTRKAVRRKRKAVKV